MENQLPTTALSRAIDPFLQRLGNGLSWIWVGLIFVIVLNVLLRYVFSEGRIELEEIQWHLYSTGFMFGLSYAFQADVHIRVDVLHERFSPELKAWIDLYGILLFVLPFTALMLIYGIPFVVDSYQTKEVSQSPGGLELRWLIKSVLVLGFSFLSLAAFARLTRLWSFLFFHAR
ncbi:MAG: TRAP transporter small permease subunit [Pseudomonadota bacterium]|uniref:Tripartite ATP-independent periplasmic transporters DctQ component domain-containing protein n=1 Tax=marine metagenome TaxID=408172 RepID=A0A381QRX9_9ZZZZ|nr:C4-dicarboxylate ABC transporter permease [Gammaproteobacteria bacterium]MEC8833794.1 TRAP transporter small permease subunit [Pseudomonadota bacterium]MEC8868962.1 TRAP transporter small permease subunit [Pseudomonadota bacterium]MEC9284504.1 TRAP transporter small permease subunit [Pseudomonadota bacterium]MEE3182796.1 TRAP transporter small permease subunit [Pseudomonadota bacterium]|tara:strand:- start:277 stop:798 length:522 start_codon:yes stop_codon:yes gene_type:complete